MKSIYNDDDVNDDVNDMCILVYSYIEFISTKFYNALWKKNVYYNENNDGFLWSETQINECLFNSLNIATHSGV